MRVVQTALFACATWAWGTPNQQPLSEAGARMGEMLAGKADLKEWKGRGSAYGMETYHMVPWSRFLAP